MMNLKDPLLSHAEAILRRLGQRVLEFLTVPLSAAAHHLP
jgi:hypothetical protein